MPDPNSDPTSPVRPNSADVRRAAQDLKEAIDAHLLAVETRFGEDDPAIESSFEHVRQLGHIYDELMIQVHGEGTPFGDDYFDEIDADDLEFEGDDEITSLPGPPDNEGDLLSIYVRRDYQLRDPELLVNRGREAHEMVTSEDPDYPEDPPFDAATSLFAMYNFAGVDGIDLIGDEAGLLPLGAVVWFMQADEPVGFELERPFQDIEERAAAHHLVFKIVERTGDEEDEPVDDTDSIGPLGGFELPERGAFTSGYLPYDPLPPVPELPTDDLPMDVPDGPVRGRSPYSLEPDGSNLSRSEDPPPSRD